MKKRGAFEFSFSWLFALIVGAIILFLAIIFISKFSVTQTNIQDTKNAKEISVLLNPLETGFEESGKTVLTLPTSSRISTRCYSTEDFGRQTLNLRSENYNKYSGNPTEISFNNKYIFFESNLEGKNFYIFSKPFNFPFKVATLNYLIPFSQEYCFIAPPREVREELEKVNLSNFKMVSVNTLELCSDKSKKICFDEDLPECSVFVDTRYNHFVQKGSTSVYYEENTALMFAGIFSDATLYECQLQRLFQRTSLLADLYSKKYFIDRNAGCAESSVGEYLSSLALLSLNVDDSTKLFKLTPTVQNLESKNPARCPLW